MGRLLPYLLSLLTNGLDINSIQTLLASLAEKMIPEIEHGSECRTQLLTWLRQGVIDDKIKSDPKEVLVCVGYVLLGIFAAEHEHTPVDPNAPLIVASTDDQAFYQELGVELGIQQVSTGDESSLSASFWLLIAEQLVVLLKKALESWLNK